MRPTFERASGLGRPNPATLREARAVAELSLSVFRRDLLAFYPQCRFELDEAFEPTGAAPDFAMVEADGDELEVSLFGARYRLAPRPGSAFSTQDLRMIRAIAAVLALRYHHLFQVQHASRLELFRGGSEDHYVAAFVEPQAYEVWNNRPSRIASTIQTLRTAALSTYENRRVSTGALLVGDDETGCRPSPSDALRYGVELTALKSIHRLCDGKQTLFLVDREGRLSEIVDIGRWAEAISPGEGPEVPCVRSYAAHARATSQGGHVCLVLSPNQEIKLFAEGIQAFSYANGRWRILDPLAKFLAWSDAVSRPALARSLFQAALELAEKRQGGLFVVVDDPGQAIGRLIAPHDALDAEPASGAPAELNPGDPMAKRALHYLARNRNAVELDPCVLEALACIDGALTVDRAGRIVAFGAILRHDAASLPGPMAIEGARTTAALVASRFGAVLKVSEDGVISCFLRGNRAWDL